MATIGDVAREAGVSRSTVSSVLTGRKYVSPRTRLRIEQAIDRLSYTVNSGARALATSRTMTLGLVNNFGHAHYVSTTAAYLVSAAERARQLGYRLTVLTGEDGVSEIRSAYASKTVDGFIIMEVLERDPRLEATKAERVPAVYIGVPTDNEGVDLVDFDYLAAGELAVNRLHTQGARTIAFVCWPNTVYQEGATYAIRARHAAELRSRELGVGLDTIECESDPRQVRRVLERILDDPHYDGLLFHNDAAAPILGELLARNSGTQLSVTGLCSARVAREHWLPFETIDTRPLESTWAAVDLLVDRLTNGGQPGTQLLLEPVINTPASDDT